MPSSTITRTAPGCKRNGKSNNGWYHNPLGARLTALRLLHIANPEKLEMLAAIQLEIDLFRKYSAYYGNVFYLLRRG